MIRYAEGAKLGMPPLQGPYWNEHNDPECGVAVDNVVSVYDLDSLLLLGMQPLASAKAKERTG